MYCTHHFKIDFEKVKTLDDVIRILKALDIAFEHSAKRLDEIMDLVKEEPKGPLTTFLD